MLEPEEVQELISEARIKRDFRQVERLDPWFRWFATSFPLEEGDGDGGDGVENVSLYVGDGGGCGGGEGHGGVVDEDETASGGGEGVEE